MEPMKILLVDDHTLFKKGIYGIFEKETQFVIVGDASNGNEAIQKVTELQPDLVLMDLYMPECDGIEATKRITAQFPDVKVVILSVEEEDHYLFEAIKAGAKGYLLKNMEPEELVHYLSGILKGEAPISRAMASKILVEFASMAQGNTNDDREGGKRELSFREREVLKLVSVGHTNKEIADELHIAENTVKNHLRNILEKLQVQNRVQAAAYAMRNGLI